MPIIEVADLKKSYGSVSALDGLEMKVPKGSLFGLLGPNGAGKTTFIRIICTLLSPDSGKVVVNGVNALSNPKFVRSNVGYVAQEVALDKILTGRELLTLQSDLYHLTSSKRMERIDFLIDRLEMSEWIDRRCGTYSGGMRRRIDLSAGLLHQPDLLILDEPTVGLDFESRKIIWKLLSELKGEGKTILLSSHYLEEVEALSDQIAIIDKGRVIANGTIDQLKKELGGESITLKVKEFSNENEALKVKNIISTVKGVSDIVVNSYQGYSLNFLVDNENVLEDISLELKKADKSVYAISKRKPSLDDIYLHATGRTLMDAEMDVLSTRDIKLERKKAMK
tara:strand:+ start:2772 stop:3785 length:1014 start_codon:yes stop_codon:yes gene_type:complete